MKKLLCIAVASVLGFAAFAEGKGGLTFNVAGRAVWSSAAVEDGSVGWDNTDSGVKQGFQVKQGEDDFYLEMGATYETGVGGAMFRIRANQVGGYNLKGGLINMDRWEAWIIPCQYLKLSVGNNPIELYAEGVKWDTLSGAGIFESAGNHLYAEIYPFDALTLGVGILNSAGLSNVTAGDTTEPQNTMAVWGTYSISCVGNISAEYEALANATSDKYDGDVKRIGAQFDYNGIDNMEAILGYSTYLLATENDGTKLAQHRVDFDFRLTQEQYAFEVFNEAVLRNSDYGDFGNRFGAKFEYYLSDSLTPWLRVNYYKNYYDNFNPGWAVPQLNNSAQGKDAWGLVVEPRLTLDMGKGVSATFGVDVRYASFNFAKVDGELKDLAWSIPLEIHVSF